MKKYTTEFKLSVVQHYLDGVGGYKEVGRQHGIAYSLVKRWVEFYRRHGVEGLKKKTSPPYSADFKMSVLRHMWDNNLSYDRTAALFDIRAQSCIGMWERSFLQGGIDALMPAAKIKPTDLSDPKPDPALSEAGERPSDETRSREDLLKELNHLRMEVAVLKKLKALVQAEQQAAARRKRK